MPGLATRGRQDSPLIHSHTSPIGGMEVTPEEETSAVSPWGQ